MFLNEVALGKPKEIVQDDRTLKRAPPGFDSVVARGQTEPGKGTILQLVMLPIEASRTSAQQLLVFMWSRSVCTNGTADAYPMLVAWWDYQCHFLAIHSESRAVYKTASELGIHNS